MDKSFQQALNDYSGDRGDLIPLLQKLQQEYGFISHELMEETARRTDIPLSHIYGVATFYKQFRFVPPGKYLIKVCDGTACHVNDSARIIETLADYLRIEPEQTTEDGLFTLSTVACLGCCSLAPAMMINDKTYGRLTDKSVKAVIDDYRNRRKELES